MVGRYKWTRGGMGKEYHAKERVEKRKRGILYVPRNTDKSTEYSVLRPQINNKLQKSVQLEDRHPLQEY